MIERGVVVGGSIAGLLAAAGLRRSGVEVTILERDDLPAAPGDRRGVPQGPQVHALLAIGVRTMDELLGGFTADLIDAGGVALDASADIAVHSSAGWIGRVASEARVVALRRAVLEHALRRRVLALAGVELRRAGVAGLAAAGGRVTGVRLDPAGVGAGNQVIEGDLVLDASGRRSAAPDWLAALGYPRPEAVHLNSHIGYATVPVRLPEGLLPPGVAGLLAHPHPGNHRGAALFPCGEGLYQLAALGMMKAHPPGDVEGFLAHLDQASSPLIGQMARKVDIAGPVPTYRMLGSQRLLWERLDPRPEGFAAIGDAVMSFNPLYGQGISVAAVEAAAVAEVVSRTGDEAAGLGRRIQDSLVPTVETVFSMVIGIDGHYPGAELIGVDPPSPEAAAYSRALAQVATEDAEAALAAKYASQFFDTAGLLTDSLRAKVAAWVRQGRTVTRNDPCTIPPPLER